LAVGKAGSVASAQHGVLKVPFPFRRRSAGCDVSEALSRPLPPVTPETEFFWSSGADGQLRFQECLNCSALIHPPQPVCRHCRSHEIGVRDVSGQATLAGFTVNHRFSIPGKPPPYVIAQVAIVEDPRVRLTTNIVADCDPEQLELGMLMEA
jgi:uncharacterized OB-fold protein